MCSSMRIRTAVYHSVCSNCRQKTIRFRRERGSPSPNSTKFISDNRPGESPAKQPREISVFELREKRKASEPPAETRIEGDKQRKIIQYAS